MEQQNVWVQAAINAPDYETARSLAAMARRAGADWIEVDDGLLCRFGYEAIRQIRAELGPEATVIADYKSPFCCFFMDELAAAGASMCTVEAGYDDFLMQEAVRQGEKHHVTPIFHISTRCDLVPALAKRAAELGAKYLFLHRYYEGDVDGKHLKLDHIRRVKEETGCVVGVTTDVFEEIEEAIREGADWVIFGKIVIQQQQNEAECRRWVETIHAHRREGAAPAR